MMNNERARMLQCASVVTALAIVLVSGLVHGKWSGRWNQSEKLAIAVSRVERVPLRIGLWQGEPVQADAVAFAKAGAQSYWMRTYTHADSKSSLLVILMCGRAGRMAVHTPEVCYQGAGFAMLEAPSRANVTWLSDAGEEMDMFWKARFRKEGGLSNDLRLFWSWNYQGTWEASANPRWEFRGEPYLYKLYISQPVSTPETPLPQDFLEKLLPALKKVLPPSTAENS